MHEYPSKTVSDEENPLVKKSLYERKGGHPDNMMEVRATTYNAWWRHHLTVRTLTCLYVAEIDKESIKRRAVFLVSHQKLCLVLFALVLARDRVRRFTPSRYSSSPSLPYFVYAPSLERKTPRRRVNMARLLALVGGCDIVFPQHSSTFYRPRDNLFLCWVCALQLGITSHSPFRPVCNVVVEWKLLPTTKGTA